MEKETFSVGESARREGPEAQRAEPAERKGRSDEPMISVEVAMSWKGQVMDAELVSLDRPRRIAVGESGRFLVPIGTTHTLLTIEPGRATLHVPPGASALVSVGDAERTLEAEQTDRTVALAEGVVAEVALADMTFFVRAVAKEKARFGGPLFDSGPARWIAAAFAMHLAILGVFAFAPPDASALSIDMNSEQMRYIQVHLAAPEQITPPPPVGATGGGSEGTSAPESASAGGNDTPTPHVAGGPGRPHVRAPRTVEGPLTTESVANLSMFNALARAFASEDGEASPYSLGSALAQGPGGPGTESLIGGPLSGPGGIGMRTAGIGTCTHEPCGTGTIDQGGLDTNGGVVPGHSADLGPRVGRPVPRIVACRATDPDCGRTVGGLSREQIRSIIARHRPEVRFCYEQALISRPDLEGRVTIGFQIAQDGHVATSNAVGATGGTDQVASCVAQAVSRWQFPSSSSPTGVTYPFILESAQSE
jgi:hypothetical protein